MKIFGKDGKEYESVESCIKADKEFDEVLVKKKADIKNKEKQRKARAEEVNESYQVYQNLLKAFIKDYGTYHTRFTINDIGTMDFINKLFNF